MNTEIFTEGSDTISSESDEIYKNYFLGQFLSIKTFGENLEQFGDVKYHILSERHGYVLGDESANDPNERSKDLYSNSIVNSGSEADVIILALKRKNFEEYVSPIWNDIIENATCQIICLSSARSALETIEVSSISDNIEVVSYNRQGVARISNKTKIDVLNTIQEMMSVDT